MYILLSQITQHTPMRYVTMHISGLTTVGQVAEDGAEGEDVGGGTTACKV